jgi:hypothetical protein
MIVAHWRETLDRPIANQNTQPKGESEGLHFAMLIHPLRF